MTHLEERRTGKVVAAVLNPDRLLTFGLAIVFAIACGLVVMIVATVLSGMRPLLADVALFRFVTDPGWHPTVGQYGFMPMLAGTTLAALGAIGLALPVAVAIGVALQFYLPPPVAAAARGALFVAAATPSVVFGFWGLLKVVPAIGAVAPPGASLLAGAIMLALMILPTTALLVDVALSKIPSPLLHGAHALGARRSLICAGLALPIVRRSVFAAGILGVARAFGETIVVLMVTGNRAEFPASVFDPVRTMTATVALEIGYAKPLHAAALHFCILLLFVVSAALALGVHILNGRDEQGRLDV